MRRPVLVLVALFVAGGLVACGASMHTSTTGSTADAQAQVKGAYEKFFSSKTPLPERVSLLQNGSRFRGVVKSFAGSPLATNTSAKVYSVQLQGANKAKVVYEVRVSGGVVPPGKQTGALRQGGSWRVDDASLCALLSLSGGLPKVCRS